MININILNPFTHIRRIIFEFEYQLKFILIFFSFHYYIFHFTSSSARLHTPFMILSAILPVILIIRLRKIYVPNSLYRTFYLFVFWFILLVTFLYALSDNEYGPPLAMTGMYLQLLLAYYFSRIDLEFLEKLFKVVAILALILLPVSLINQTIDLSLILKRELVGEDLFYFAGSFWAVIPFVIISFLKEKNIGLSLLYWAVSVGLNLMFLKRFIIVDSILLLLIVLFINGHKTKKIFNLSTIIFLTFLGLISVFFITSNYFLPLYELTVLRIEDTSEDFSSFDRFIETENYLDDTAPFELITGKGFAGSHSGLGKFAYALHMAWGNFLLKGGVLLILLVLIPYLKIMSLVGRFRRLPVDLQFSYLYLIIQFLRFFYISMHTNRPELLIFFYAILKVMDYEILTRKQISTKKVYN